MSCQVGQHNWRDHGHTMQRMVEMPFVLAAVPEGTEEMKLFPLVPLCAPAEQATDWSQANIQKY